MKVTEYSTTKEKSEERILPQIKTSTEKWAANRFEVINTLAVPLVTYSFNIINWKMSEIKRLDTKTQKLLHLQNAPPQGRREQNVPRQES